MKDLVCVVYSEGVGKNDRYEKLLSRATAAALRSARTSIGCEIAVCLTGRDEIRRLNREKRDIDRETDVLSFPATDISEGEDPAQYAARDSMSGSRLFLGDMAISIPRCREQAEELGHSIDRELAFLCVHSVLHMLGYDHVNGGEQEERMLAMQRKIMKELSL